MLDARQLEAERRLIEASQRQPRRTQHGIEGAGFRVEWLERMRIEPGTPAIYGVARPIVA